MAISSYLKTVTHEGYSCSIRCFEHDEVDRSEKFERYPLQYVIEALGDDQWTGRDINYYEIGANVGCSVLLAGKMLEGRGQVVAFEVEPTNYNRLVQNITVNRLANAIGLPFGIGDKCDLTPFFINQRHLVDDQPRVGEGLHSFHTYDNMAGWHGKEHSFLACVFPLDFLLDALPLKTPTHVFIDAFGSELEIIKGMDKTIQQGGVDVMMVQIETVGRYDKGENFDLESNATYQHLIERGYALADAHPLPGIEDFLRGYNCVFRR